MSQFDSESALKAVLIDTEHKSKEELEREIAALRTSILHQGPGFIVPVPDAELKNHNLVSKGFAVGAILGLSSGYFIALIFNGLVG